MTFTYKYPRPALTVDCAVFGLHDAALHVLLIQRRNVPFSGQWALPGGFVEMNETVEDAASRELEEETGLHTIPLEQLHCFSEVDRDPRTRVVSIPFLSLVTMHAQPLAPATDATAAKWYAFNKIPKLAFDHDRILKHAREHLKRRIRSTPLGLDLLPPEFSLSQLQQVYETVLAHRLDKRNFRRKVKATNLLIPLHTKQVNVSGRPAQLYRFNQSKYNRLQRRGFEFRI